MVQLKNWCSYSFGIIILSFLLWVLSAIGEAVIDRIVPQGSELTNWIVVVYDWYQSWGWMVVAAFGIIIMIYIYRILSKKEKQTNNTRFSYKSMRKIASQLAQVQRKMILCLGDISNGCALYQDVLQEIQVQDKDTAWLHAQRRELERLELIEYEDGYMGLTEKGFALNDWFVEIIEQSKRQASDKSEHPS